MKARARNDSAIQLDKFDLAILAILERDNTIPQREIGHAVNLSAPAVQRRVRRMEEAGVIRANIAVVDPVSVGRPLTVIVAVDVESERANLLDAMKASFSAAPEVQQCYYVAGEADFILVISVATMTEYEAVTRRLFFANPNVKRFRTFVAMDRVKTSLGVMAHP